MFEHILFLKWNPEKIKLTICWALYFVYQLRLSGITKPKHLIFQDIITKDFSYCAKTVNHSWLVLLWEGKITQRTSEPGWDSFVSAEFINTICQSKFSVWSFPWKNQGFFPFFYFQCAITWPLGTNPTPTISFYFCGWMINSIYTSTPTWKLVTTSSVESHCTGLWLQTASQRVGSLGNHNPAHTYNS